MESCILMWDKRSKSSDARSSQKISQPSPWVFKDSPESRCLTTQLVIEQKEPILTVHHDVEDDVWAFWPYLPHSARDKAIVSTLERVVSLHPFVREFADL